MPYRLFKITTEIKKIDKVHRVFSWSSLRFCNLSKTPEVVISTVSLFMFPSLYHQFFCQRTNLGIISVFMLLIYEMIAKWCQALAFSAFFLKKRKSFLFSKAFLLRFFTPLFLCRLWLFYYLLFYKVVILSHLRIHQFGD